MLKENYYRSLIDGMPFHIGDQKMEYVSCFGSYDLLVEYIYRLRQEGKVKSSYLPEDMIACLDLALEWYEGIMNLLTAFKMTEQADMSMDEKVKVRHLNLACNLFGIALQKDIAVVTDLLIGMVTDSLHAPSLMNLFKVSVVNQWKIRRLKKNFYGLQLFKYPQYLCILLLYIHVSEKYDRDMYDNLPEKQRKQIMRKFHDIYVKYVSHD